MKFKHIICYKKHSNKFETEELERHIEQGWKVVVVLGLAHNDVLISKI